MIKGINVEYVIYHPIKENKTTGYCYVIYVIKPSLPHDDTRKFDSFIRGPFRSSRGRNFFMTIHLAALKRGWLTDLKRGWFYYESNFLLDKLVKNVLKVSYKKFSKYKGN